MTDKKGQSAAKKKMKKTINISEKKTRRNSKK